MSALCQPESPGTSSARAGAKSGQASMSAANATNERTRPVGTCVMEIPLAAAKRVARREPDQATGNRERDTARHHCPLIPVTSTAGQGIGHAPVRPVGGLDCGAEGELSARQGAARALFAPKSGGAGWAH